MPAKGGAAHHDYQVYWDDLTAWIEQLYAEHGCRTRIGVSMEPERYQLRPTVTVEIYRTRADGKQESVYREWRSFDNKSKGGAEKVALQLLSQMLLELDREQERAERQASLFSL